MQMVGAVPAGARGLRAVAAVVDARPVNVAPTAPDVARAAIETRTLVETVVLPRERAKVDARPDELRKRAAIARYQEPPAEPNPPGPRGRARYA